MMAEPASTASRLAVTAATTARTAMVIDTWETNGLFSCAACSACSACSWASSVGSVIDLLALPAQRRLRRRQPRDRRAIGRTGHVVQTHLLAERDRGGVAAVLATDAELDVAAHRPPTLGRDADQLAHALAVDGHERVALEDA